MWLSKRVNEAKNKIHPLHLIVEVRIMRAAGAQSISFCFLGIFLGKHLDVFVVSASHKTGRFRHITQWCPSLGGTYLLGFPEALRLGLSYVRISRDPVKTSLRHPRGSRRRRWSLQVL